MELALQDFKKAIRLAPSDDALAYVARAETWVEIGDLDKALADFSEAIRRDQYFQRAYVSRAGIWARNEELQKALADYSKAIQLAEDAAGKHPEYDFSYIERAVILADLGEFEKAINDYNATIARYGALTKWLIPRGELWWKINNLDNALLDFTEAVREEKESQDAHNAFALFLATADDARYRNGKRALEHATRACDLSGWCDADSFDALAAAHAEAGDFKLAAAWQAKAIELTRQETKKPDLKLPQMRLKLYESGKPYREKVTPRPAVEKTSPPAG